MTVSESSGFSSANAGIDGANVPAVLNGPSLLGFRWFLESGDRTSTLFFSKNGLVAPKIRRRRLENLVCSIIQVDATRGIPHCADPFRTAANVLLGLQFAPTDVQSSGICFQNGDSGSNHSTLESR